MPIKKPGVKFRHNRILRSRGAKRSVAAVLSLTAMVDMFTVLVVFLLQNYNTTGEVLYLPKDVMLPQAEAVKELKPSHVVTVSAEAIHIDDRQLMDASNVISQEDWMITELYYELKDRIELAKSDSEKNMRTVIRQAIAAGEEEVDESWRKVTIQADEDVDFLTVKKIMFTVTEAGAGEINFAVRKTRKEVPN